MPQTTLGMPAKKNAPTDYKLKIITNQTRTPWLVIVIGMLLGALIGFLISTLLPPVYEARSLVTTNMEIVEDANINETMVDAEINHIGELAYHPDVINKLIEIEGAQGNELTLEDLKRDGSVERQLMNTILKVQNRDPQIAARIASEWSQILYTRLAEAYPHAVVLSAAKAQFGMLETCLEDPVSAKTLYCWSLTSDEMVSEMRRLETMIAQESPLSLGLTKDLNVSQFQPAAIPETPLNFQKGTLMLSGTLVGLFAAIIYLEIKPSKEINDEI